jgi:type IV pilus assembly protein PilQ
MRKQLVAMFLTLLLASPMAVAETQNAGVAMPGNTAAAAAKPVSLKHIDVAQAADGVEVTLTASQPVTPRATVLSNPSRLVLDLPNTLAATGQRHIAVDKDGVKAVRVGQDGLLPPTTRVVVDLSAARDYQVTADGNRLLVKFQGSSGAAVPAAPAPTAAKLQAQPATQTAAAQPTRPAAQDFAFVEPSYKAKEATKDDVAKDATSQNAAVNAAPARAIEAAAKFAEKPLDGVTTPANASLKADDSASTAKVDPAVNLAAEQKAQRNQQPAATGPKYTGEPISVNLKDVDLKDFFRLVHEISGLNVVLDPNVKGSLTLVLDDVPWDQALDIVLKNNDLARQLEGNVLRIATVDTLKREAESRRAQQEAEAMAVEKVTVTRFLSYSRSKDVVPTLKKFLTQRGDVISDDRTNALIISDIPNVIPQLDRLLTQLDRKTQEVEIEARVVAATRSFARDLGTQLGVGWGNGPTAIGGATSVGTTPTQVFGLNPSYITVGGTATQAGTQIPLFTNMPVPSPNSGLSFLNFSKNYRIDAILTMAESRGLLKILSRPRVVTQNNIQAIVKQGVRVPIVTQAQLGGPPTVTYVDAFLRLTVTPQITSEGTIFLNVDVENTTPDFGRSVQGNPTLITQQATTQVLVTDGGTVVIGGVIQTQNSSNVSQVPLLGSVPYLGNLFKRRTVQTSNQELIFFITPRIIQT